MRIIIEGWDPVDRQPVRGELAGVDRGQTQAADLVTVVLSTSGQQEGQQTSGTSQPSTAASSSSSDSTVSVVIKQNPTLLQKTKPGEVRVGACMWDSGYVLCALLEQEVRRNTMSLAGARCVELGAGCGLVGLMAARLGASVMLTGGASCRAVGFLWGVINRERLCSSRQGK